LAWAGRAGGWAWAGAGWRLGVGEPRSAGWVWASCGWRDVWGICPGHRLWLGPRWLRLADCRGRQSSVTLASLIILVPGAVHFLCDHR
jgi:hypothetical protein